ncbi:hypothetical protein [Photobacterium proteolyticum]|nr:hypothetical protein [Photobacterium proteolyticum]
MASRNAQYEQRRIDKGEKKITLWVPLAAQTATYLSTLSATLKQVVTYH